ncbi:transketolase subunit B [Anaerobacterium chartisolvens]|uniref:Transketolase subunit B n=1 Tax=Anaerobacterium chartisolvens TaxID=1297424 RepID=A0A369B3F1_9FIRM|nr:transketolase family protein [Anaerobacterium chartisolvens]RCX16110.1 transketolase subunit B [Anaerobacterium chartisolvens]
MADKIATRHAYGEALSELGKEPNVVALDADVSTCTMSCMFGEKYPDRFYNVGIAEANMVGIAAGMSTLGQIPFIHTFAMFAAGRTYDQIRNTLAYPHLNVKVVGTHAGLTVGEDGATHQCLEDLGLMRAIPEMVVICPCDGNETKQAVRAIASYNGPCYLRLGRLAVDVVTEFPGYKFEIGKAQSLKDGTDATIIATGIMVQIALKAAAELEKENINVRVLNMHTIKPIDKDAIINAAKETGAIITAEEHNVLTGLGSAVSEVVTDTVPVPVLKVGTEDTFGKSGNAEALMERFGLNKENIIEKVKKSISMKK